MIGAGKSGYVVAFRAARRQAALDARDRQAQQATSPARCRPSPSSTAPAPSAACSPRWPKRAASLYVPWIDLCFKGSATGLVRRRPGAAAPGGLAAVDAATGAIIWKHTFKSIDSGAATVANNVVFTSTYDGTIYALSTKTGAILWTTKAPAGINSFPAVTKTMLIVGAGAPTSTAKATSGEIIAYALPG